VQHTSATGSDSISLVLSAVLYVSNVPVDAVSALVTFP
jgi:hypothetical protein